MRFQILMTWLLLTPALLHADGLSDVKTTLRNLQGHEAVQVRLEYRLWRQAGSDCKMTSPSEGQIGARLAEDPATLRVEWDTTLVQRVEEEARQHDVDAKSPTPLRESLKDLDAGRLHHLLNQGPVLMNLIAESKFVRESQEPLEGKASRLLVFAFEPRVPSYRLRRLSKREGELKVWIDGEGIPLRMESTIRYQGKMSRFFGAFSVKTVATTVFNRHENRLMVGSRSLEDEAWDSGDVTRTKSVVSLKP